jgi:hypothetical protein
MKDLPRMDRRTALKWMLAAAATTTLAPRLARSQGGSPAASAVGVVDFLDEWISAPYPDQAEDRAIVLPGLAWIDLEADRRFGRGFADLDDAQKTAICDDICHTARARPEFKQPAGFFATFRNLTAAGYYTTPPGRKDIGYVGNMPLATFDGPPPEVLKQAGLI